MDAGGRRVRGGPAGALVLPCGDLGPRTRGTARSATPPGVRPGSSSGTARAPADSSWLDRTGDRFTVPRCFGLPRHRPHRPQGQAGMRRRHTIRRSDHAADARLRTVVAGAGVARPAATRTSRQLGRRNSRSRRARTARVRRMTSRGCRTPRSPGRAARSTRSRSGILRTACRTTRPGNRTAPSSGSTTLATAHDTDRCDLDRHLSKADSRPRSTSPPDRFDTAGPSTCQ